MPNYEYKCKDCETVINLSCTMSELSDLRPKVCPECGGDKIIVLFSNSKAIWNCGGSYEKGD